MIVSRAMFVRCLRRSSHVYVNLSDVATVVDTDFLAGPRETWPQCLHWPEVQALWAMAAADGQPDLYVLWQDAGTTLRALSGGFCVSPWPKRTFVYCTVTLSVNDRRYSLLNCVPNHWRVCDVIMQFCSELPDVAHLTKRAAVAIRGRRTKTTIDPQGELAMLTELDWELSAAMDRATLRERPRCVLRGFPWSWGSREQLLLFLRSIRVNPNICSDIELEKSRKGKFTGRFFITLRSCEDFDEMHCKVHGQYAEDRWIEVMRESVAADNPKELNADEKLCLYSQVEWWPLCSAGEPCSRVEK